MNLYCDNLKKQKMFLILVIRILISLTHIKPELAERRVELSVYVRVCVWWLCGCVPAFPTTTLHLAFSIFSASHQHITCYEESL